MRLARVELLMREFMGDKNTSLYDLLPFEEQPEENTATFEQFVAVLRSTVRH